MTSVLLIAAAQLAFSVETIKSTYLVGEPVVMIVTQHGAARIYDDGWFGLGYPDTHFRILIDRGRGFERFRRKLLTSPLTERADRIDVEDGRRQEFVLSFDDAIDDVVFPAAGEARIAVEYEDPVIGLVRSQVATVWIVAPEGVERDAYERLRAMDGRGAQFYLELTSNEGAPALTDDASRNFVASFPASVYVQGARVRSLAANPRRTIAEAEALVDDLRGGQFEPDALVVLAMAYDQYGHYALADATWQRIVDAFPGRDAADAAREVHEEDDEAPEHDVDLIVRPTRIAADGRFVPVHVDVAGTKTALAGVVLRLVEVKCGHTCDREQDVWGVALGTDDRDFEVPAAHGEGYRAYMFVYEVTQSDGSTRTIGAVVQVGQAREVRPR
jgi:hypothetical protein